MELPQKYLGVQPINGLGNRLRVLFSYKLLADHLNLPYFVHWTESAGFDDTKITELLDVPTDRFNFELVDVNAWKMMRDSSIPIDSRIDGVNEISVENQWRQERDMLVYAVLSGNYDRMTAKASNLLPWALGEPLVESRIRGFKQMYKKLVRTIEVGEQVKISAEKVHKRFDKNTIGVHIRHGDALSSRNKRHEMHSNEVLDVVVDKLDKLDSTIYLTTDSKEVQTRFVKRYGSRVLYYDKNFVESIYGEPKMGQFDAMTEMYLLSKTNRILVTSPSSFAKFASDMGNIEYEIIGEVFDLCPDGNKLMSVVGW